MEPVTFQQSNTQYGPPVGMAESQVRIIPAYQGKVEGGSMDGVDIVVVAWKPTPEEIEAIKNGAPVFFSSLGGLMPHYLCTSFEEAIKVA